MTMIKSYLRHNFALKLHFSHSKHIVPTCTRPRPPGLDQSKPQMTHCYRRWKQREVLNDVVEDGQTAVVIKTSVDCSEPVDSLSVNLVTLRVIYSPVVTVPLCSFIKYNSAE